MNKKGDTTLDGKIIDIYNSIPDVITKKAVAYFIKEGEARYTSFGGRILNGLLNYKGTDYAYDKK